MPDRPVKRRISAAERASGAQGHDRSTAVAPAASTYRRFLLVPVVPVAALLGLALLALLLSALPQRWTIVVLFPLWVGSFVDAARRTRPGWVAAIVLFWPSLLAYWTVRLFRLGRPTRSAPPA